LDINNQEKKIDTTNIHSIQISGSIAFDTLLTYQGKFSEHILNDQISSINVAFLVPEMRKEFGGCAANIAYNLNALGDTCILLGSVGRDAKEYVEKFQKLGIQTSQLINCQDEYTAQAFITSDEDGNQITSFHPGAMMSKKISDLSLSKTSIGIISPNSHHAMTQNANDFFERKINFIFDPGQALPMFNRSDLSDFISKATWIAVNEYEGEMLCKLTGVSLEELPHKLLFNDAGGVFQTLGNKGCRVFTKETNTLVEPIKVSKAVDPTGCGDAFRAGILYGLARGFSPQDSACIGNVLGSIKVQTIGGQNHSIHLDNILELIMENFPNSKINLSQ
jgi:adenosine kinase